MRCVSMAFLFNKVTTHETRHWRDREWRGAASSALTTQRANLVWVWWSSGDLRRSLLSRCTASSRACGGFLSLMLSRRSGQFFLWHLESSHLNFDLLFECMFISNWKAELDCNSKELICSKYFGKDIGTFSKGFGFVLMGNLPKLICFHSFCFAETAESLHVPPHPNTLFLINLLNLTDIARN